MRKTVNPLLSQVLHRRRMLRGVRLSTAAWVIFGGLHIAVWWLAFQHTPQGWPRGQLVAAVWPLLLVATASFIMLIVYVVRWLLSPVDASTGDWYANSDDDEPTIVRLRA